MEFEESIIKVKKPAENIVKTLEEQYLEIGKKFGYMPVQSPLFLCMKKKGSQAGIEVQFGGEQAFFESLEKLSKSCSDICILATSSKAHTLRLEDARALLFKRFEIKAQKYFFVDIETQRYIAANAEWEKFSSKINRPEWAIPGPMPLQPIFKKKKNKTKK